jgi:hypothetical protein
VEHDRAGAAARGGELLLEVLGDLLRGGAGDGDGGGERAAERVTTTQARRAENRPIL